MKRLITDEAETGLESLLGKKVLLLCANYFYTGTLVGVSDADVELQNSAIVYETGDWSNETFEDQQAMRPQVFVRVAAIESYIQSHA